MSYNVGGDGYIVLKEESNIGYINDYFLEAFIHYEEKGCGVLTVNVGYNEYDEIKVLNCLDRIIPYISDGNIVFYDEDGDVWKFVYNKEEENWIDIDIKIMPLE